MGSRLHEALDVLRREMGCKQAHCRQVEPPLSQRDEEGRELPSGPSRLDALRRRVLGQAQLSNTVRMHGRIAGRRVQPARIDLGDMGENGRRGHAIVGDEGRQIAKENGIAEMGQRVVAHDSTCSRGGSSDSAWSTDQASMGVLILYHEAFHPPERLMARTHAARESFAIPCSRSGLAMPRDGTRRCAESGHTKGWRWNSEKSSRKFFAFFSNPGFSGYHLRSMKSERDYILGTHDEEIER